MRPCRPLSALLLWTAISSGCHDTAPLQAAAQPAPPRPRAPMPQLAEAEAPAPAPASPSCAEGYKPSTQFVRKPWLDAYEAVRKLTNIWVISTDHDYYTDHTFVIVPRGPEAVLFDAGLIGGGLCTGEQSSTLSSLEVELHGNALHVRLRGENNEWSPDSASGGVCERSHTDVADYTYDPKTNLGCEAFHVE